MNATFPSHGARDNLSNGARDTLSSADAYSCSAPSIWRKGMTAASTGSELDRELAGFGGQLVGVEFELVALGRQADSARRIRRGLLLRCRLRRRCRLAAAVIAAAAAGGDQQA